MKQVMLAGLLLLAFVSTAFAWNDKGHMVVAQLAYEKLSPSQRDTIFEILKKHPHYKEFLIAEKPDNIAEAQWVFWRAATWSDWVRTHHKAEYHKGTWHYVDYPFVPKGGSSSEFVGEIMV
jgi:hypothetical protein